MVVFLAFFGIILSRVFLLQIINGENYAEIRYDGLYKQVVEREIGKMDGHRTAEEMFVKNGRAETGILGMEPAALSVERRQ